MAGQGQEKLDQKLSLEHLGYGQRRSIWEGQTLEGATTSSTLACQHKAPGHLALLTHCDSKRALLH